MTAIDINRNANDYWMRVMDIARKFNVPRVKRQVILESSEIFNNKNDTGVLRLWVARMRMI